MNSHTALQLKLYEFLRDELPEDERAAVADHLAGCATCRDECDVLREAMQLFPADDTRPSDTLPQAFWTGILNEVDQRIMPMLPGRSWRQRVADWLTMTVVPHRRFALALGSLGIVAVSAFVTWSLLRQTPERPLVAEAVQPVAGDAVRETRMGSYLRRSQMLLVGLTNAPVDEGQLPDLAIERETSRHLVEEARMLKQQSLDDRSVRLINDLQKIQIELANMDPHNDLPTMELVLSSIRRENLLFKIRMEETINPQVRYARDE